MRIHISVPLCIDRFYIINVGNAFAFKKGSFWFLQENGRFRWNNNGNLWVVADPINMYASHSEVRTVHFSNNPIFSFATSKITPSEAEVMTFFPVSTKSIINNFTIYQYVHYLITYNLRLLRYIKIYILQYLPCQSIALEGMGDVTIYL